MVGIKKARRIAAKQAKGGAYKTRDMQPLVMSTTSAKPLVSQPAAEPAAPAKPWWDQGSAGKQ